jgi:hypothetical protein
MTRLYAFFGGRKQFSAYLAVTLVVGYALITDPAPDFLSFAAAIGGILGVGSFMVAFEDRARK